MIAGSDGHLTLQSTDCSRPRPACQLKPTNPHPTLRHPRWSALAVIILAAQSLSQQTVLAVTPLTALSAAQPVTIDGTIGATEWSDATVYAFDAQDTTAPGVVVQGTTTSPTDTSARLYVKQDATYLYVAVQVTDDVVVKTATYAWDADVVELFLDPNNTKSTNVGLNRLQFDIGAGGQTVATPCVPAGCWTGAAAVITGGYSVEYRIRKADIGLTGTQCGFDVAINDVEPTAGNVQTRYWCFSTAAAETNESLWGTLSLNTAPANLSVSPAGGMAVTGKQGGPFTPATATYTLTNGGTTAINWTAAKTQSWVTLSKASGTLAAGASDTVSVAVNSGANSLAAGSYSDSITFTNASTGSGNTTRAVTLTVNATPGALAVSPSSALAASGNPGGPFTPATAGYTLTNSGGSPINWTAAKTQSWVTLSKASGTLAAGASDTVTASIGSGANSLAAGSYSDTITFTNTTNAAGNTTRSVTLSVASTVVKSLTAPFTSQPITVDGVLGTSEWGDAVTLAFNAQDSTPPGVVVMGTPVASTDTSARVLVKHDSTYLYVAVQVMDDVVVKTGTNAWDADVVELFLDPNNTRSTNVGISRLQFDINAGGQTAATPMVPAGCWTAAASVINGGYSVEYRIRKADIGLIGGQCGFDIAISDVEPSAGTVQTEYWCFSTASAESNESLWGTLILTPGTGGLTVTPTTCLNTTGNVGGPFTPTSSAHTLTNNGSTAINWTAAKTQSWVSLSKTSGTLAAGATDTVTVSVNSGANSLAAGSYTDTVTFTNATNGAGNTARNVAMTVSPAAGALTVTPSGNLLSYGQQGGPFNPATANYTLTNSGSGSINWTAAKTQSWITLSKTSGTLAAGASDTVTVAFGTGANALTGGTYTDTVTFTNTTNGAGNATRSATLHVIPALTIGASPASGNAPLYVQYTALEGTSPASHLPTGSTLNWDFGDGTAKATGVQVTHTFNAAGNFLVALSLTLPSGLGTVPTTQTTTQVTTAPSDTGTPMTTASRTSGVAPLAVYFDAVDTTSPVWTSGVIQPTNGDYASFYYKWDFADPGSGTWATDKKSKNVAIGYGAAHLFETPGTYRVKLQVTDATGKVSNYYQDITVQAFSGTTYYVSNSGSDSNNGQSTSSPFKTWQKAISVSGANRRVLFNRGETFPASGEYYVNSGSGRFIIGAYGSGANPVIQYSRTYQVLDLNSASLEVTIMDVDFTGPGTQASCLILGSHDILCRSHVNKFNIGIIDGNGESFNDDDFVIDCNVENTNLYDMYGYGYRRTAILGSQFGYAGSTQVRLYSTKALVGHNLFQGYALRDFLKCLGLRDSQGHNRFSIISDNQFLNPPDHLQIVMLGPENNVAGEGLDQRIEDLVIERNVWNAGTAVDCGAIASNQGNRITVRNNVFINLERCIMQNVKVGEGWNTWLVYNNSVYNSTSPWNPRFVEFNDSVNDMRVFNNACSLRVPATSGVYGMCLPGTTLSQITDGNNMWNVPSCSSMIEANNTDYTLASWQAAGKGAASKTADPLFQNASGGVLSLQTSSPAIGAAVSTPYVREDINGKLRPSQGCDMGAYQQ